MMRYDEGYGRGRQGGGWFVRARAGYGGDFAGRDPGDRYACEDAAGGMDFAASRGGGYGRDFARGTGGGGYGRGMRGGGGYDLPFRDEGRPEDSHPRCSPVGGSYAAGHLPRPLADARRASEWTRWS
jgi:hypothetical protein